MSSQSNSSFLPILHTISISLYCFPGFTSLSLSLFSTSRSLYLCFIQQFFPCSYPILYLSLPACFLNAWQGFRLFCSLYSRVCVSLRSLFTHLCAYVYVHSCIYECVIAVVKQAVTPPPPHPALCRAVLKREYLSCICWSMGNYFFQDINHLLKHTLLFSSFFLFRQEHHQEILTSSLQSITSCWTFTVTASNPQMQCSTKQFPDLRRATKNQGLCRHTSGVMGSSGISKINKFICVPQSV